MLRRRAFTQVFPLSSDCDLNTKKPLPFTGERLFGAFDAIFDEFSVHFARQLQRMDTGPQRIA